MDSTQKTSPWFIALAIVVVTAAVSSTGNYIYHQVEGGVFPWGLYPALFLLFGALFAFHAFISKGKQ